MRTPVDPAPGAPPSFTHRQIQMVYVGLMVTMLLPAMNITLVATALPTIVADLGGLAQLSWVVTAYLLASTVCVPLVGKASDLHGRKRWLHISIIIFVVGSVLCGVAMQMWHLVGARVVQGIGGGALMALTQAIIGDVVTPRQRGRYQGYLGAVFAFASITGPLVGGAFVDHASWRWAFFINVPLGLLALLVTHRYLRLPHIRIVRPIDYGGAVLLVVSASSLLLVMMWGGGDNPWSSPLIVGLVATTVIGTIAFIGVEMRAAEPIVPLSLFRDPVFSVGSAIGLLCQACLVGALVFVPLFLQSVAGVSATHSGLLLLPVIGTMLITSIASGRMISRWGRYKIFPVVGTGLVVIGYGLMAGAGEASDLVAIGLRLALVGAGLGLTLQNMVLVVQNVAPPGQMGVATSGVQFFRMLGAAAGVGLFGAVLNARLKSAFDESLPAGVRRTIDLAELTGDPTAIGLLDAAVRGPVVAALASALGAVFAVGTALAGLAALLTWVLPERELRETVGDQIIPSHPLPHPSPPPPGTPPPSPPPRPRR